MLKEVVNYLVAGFDVGELHVSAVASKARFPEERNLEIIVSKDGLKSTLAYAKVFYGRPPYYRAWVEIFNIRPLIVIGKPLAFFNSPLEDVLLDVFSKGLSGGERIFVEYVSDRETLSQLLSGFPPPTTRLGFKLYLRGFTWFKDWYFPEGFMEGNPKLQAEKPLNRTWLIRNLKEILRETKEVLEKYGGRKASKLRAHELAALANARRIVEDVTQKLSQH